LFGENAQGDRQPILMLQKEEKKNNAKRFSRKDAERKGGKAAGTIFELPETPPEKQCHD